jgi:hypothetical protein
VSGKGSGRVSIAGLLCLQFGRRGRLMWRTKQHRGRAGERGSFSEEDYIAFLDQAHQRLRTPIVLCWDNLNTHVSRRMRALIAGRDWLTVVRLPAYAPDLNPPRASGPGRNVASPTPQSTASTTSPAWSDNDSTPANNTPTSSPASSPKPE